MNDIGAKIGLDGAKQFNQDLKNLTQTGKTLSAQMGALTASFDKAENKEELFAKATETLNQQVENQKKKIDFLKDAVKKASDEFGENATRTQKLKEQLAKAEIELSKLENTTAESALGMKELASEEKDAGKEAENAGGKVSAFTIALGQLAADAIKEGFNFMVDSLKNIVKFFADATTGAANYADEINTLAKTTSLSTDTLQEYKYMASLTDVSLETITGSMTKLTRNMSSAKDGTGAAADAFASLGISVTDADGNLRSTNDVFADVIDALGSIDNEAERDATAMSLFGKSAQDLNPLIEAGSDALNDLRQEAHDVGYVLDGDTLDSLNDVNDGFDRLGLAADSIKNKVGSAIGQYILPYLNDLVGAVQDLMKDGDVDKFTERISTIVTDLASSLASALPTVLKVGGEIIGKLIMGINKMLPSLAPAAVSLISELARFIIANLPTIINTAVEIILALVNGLAQEMPTLIPAAIQMIITIVEGLLSHIGDIIAAALALINGLVEGLTGPDGIQLIIEAIPVLIMSLVEGILNNLPQIIAAGISIIVNLVYGLVQAIPEIIKSIPTIIIAIVDTFANYDWGSLGGDIMSNIGDGVKDKATAMWQAVQDAFKTAIEWIKNLGKQALEWGKDMISGFASGIMEKAQALLDKVKSVAQKIKGFLHFSRPDYGPLRDYENWMPDFMMGLAKGIDDNAWRVEAAMRNVASDMTVKGGTTTNLGGVNIVVNASEGQSANDIANMVMMKMQQAVNSKKAVFA